MKQIQTPMTIPTTTMKKTTILFILLLLALPNGYAKAAEKFSGVMEMMLTMPSGKGELTFSFGSAAQRMDMFLQMDNIPAPVRSTIPHPSLRARPGNSAQPRHPELCCT